MRLIQKFMDKQPILSICVPIYNRKIFLERMLSRFLEDRQLFQDDIQLYISDNCSTEDVKGVAEHFYTLGLNLEYHCNDRNLGMDGNFINCFNHAKGKYTWLLGSDDVPVKGLLIKLLNILKEKDYGLLHLSDRDIEKFGQIVEYTESNQLCEDLHVFITFISGNIVRTNKMMGLDLKKYDGTIICQVPLYLEAILTSEINAILYTKYLESENDSKNNGGYNLFQVFVDNLNSIFKEYVHRGLLSPNSFKSVKQNAYKNWLLSFVLDFLVYGKAKKSKFKSSDSWHILIKHYGMHPYAYYYAFLRIVKDIIRKVIRIS